jgi:hypothetical protein
MHIGDFRKYSKYLSVVLRIYMVTIVLIAIFGWYMMLTSKYVPIKKTASPVQKLDF